jgi:photosystem II stability/assembly factor-like uncharacterized protein
MIGPFRGGRTVGATGVPRHPNIFYIGVNNGGVWKSDDYGRTWKPLFDDQPTGSIGDLAVAPSDPNVLYVGSGEGLHRPDLSVGDGIFKSTDGGATWSHKGLDDAQQIGAVIVDPTNPNRLFVASLGHPYGPNTERGVFRSTNGGDSWEKVLYKNENTGAMSVAFDPTNPDILYADLWEAREGPWENSTWIGPESGLYKSTDGGNSWQRLTNGLPVAREGVGRIGFGVAPSDPQRIYATVESRSREGVYRSDDGGAHWERINTDPRLTGRGYDFGEIKVDPRDRNTVYVCNIAAYKSTDGGMTFYSFKGAPGGDDYHRIWINPENPGILLLVADQGAAVSVNGGRTWSSWYNQPTAQHYHVSTDNQFPYNVYASQQESGSVCIASRSNDGAITFRDWHPVGADEYSFVAPDPLDPNIVYGGRVSRYDRRTGQTAYIAPEAVRSAGYRVLRSMPLMFSPVDPRKLYFATNRLFVTTTGGQQWEVISPDLSRKNPDTTAPAGMVPHPDMPSGPPHGVIYALAPSPRDSSLIWAGTDDGLIHRTTNGGKVWVECTPKALSPWSKISSLEAGHDDVNTVYAAVNRIRLDDMRPHIYRTHDGGKTWKEIVAGLPDNGPVNIVREDPVRKGLLFAGTERAVSVSFDDGDHWQSLRLNMPATSMRDLVIHGDDIVVATHGRSLWILDDITPLRQISGSVVTGGAFLFAPQNAYRVRWDTYSDTPLPPDEPAGENPPDGAVIDYYLQGNAAAVSLEFIDAAGHVVRRFTSADTPEIIDSTTLPHPTYWIRQPRMISPSPGLHRFVWNLCYDPPAQIKQSYPISAIYRNTTPAPEGPLVMPGEYTVRLMVDGAVREQQLTVLMDPRVVASTAALQEQFDASMQCYEALNRLSRWSMQIDSLLVRLHALDQSTLPAGVRQLLGAVTNGVERLRGTGSPSAPTPDYSGVTASPAQSDSIVSVQTRLAYLLVVLQSADAEPTGQALQGIEGQRETITRLDARWVELTKTISDRINPSLTKAGLSPVLIQ